MPCYERPQTSIATYIYTLYTQTHTVHTEKHQPKQTFILNVARYIFAVNNISNYI